MKATTTHRPGRSVRLALALALSFAAASISTSARADINIGVVLSLTGPGASLGIPENDTIKLWPKTMGNEKVVVTVLNDNSDSTAAATAARKLVTDNKVDVLIGSSVTPPSIAMVEVAGETKVALLSLAGGGAIVEPQEGNRKWAFKFSPTETYSSDLIVDHMTKNHVASVAVIGLANAYGEGFVKNFERIAAAKGIRILASERYATTDTSVVAQVVKMLSAKPDAIYIAASGTPGALPQIELAQRGWKGPTYQTQGVANNDFLRLGGKALEGTFMTTAPVLVAEQLKDSDPIKQPALEYVNVFEGAYGPNTRSLFGATAWDVFFMLRQVVDKASRTTKPGTPEFRAAIRDGMENLKDFVSAEGVYTMSDKDHNGVDARCQVLVRIENGRWKLVQ
jgi:branched-chain amino acid transport system substrate-binding protein